MADVIVQYRNKRYSTQADFALAAGVDKQSVGYWETQMYLNDPDKRVFLAKLLKIPQPYLG